MSIDAASVKLLDETTNAAISCPSGNLGKPTTATSSTPSVLKSARTRRFLTTGPHQQK
jgi:hypothetical protein